MADDQLISNKFSNLRLNIPNSLAARHHGIGQAMFADGKVAHLPLGVEQEVMLAGKTGAVEFTKRDFDRSLPRVTVAFNVEREEAPVFG
ncbi:hypothetical protein D3C86_2004340 [compost metagenome]